MRGIRVRVYTLYIVRTGEVRILRDIRHENIIAVLDMFTMGDGAQVGPIHWTFRIQYPTFAGQGRVLGDEPDGPLNRQQKLNSSPSPPPSHRKPTCTRSSTPPRNSASSTTSTSSTRFFAVSKLAPFPFRIFPFHFWISLPSTFTRWASSIGT